MTAVVGILNKKAVAIAADSAVTLSNGKIFTKANKVFTLSKFHPVGIMIHNIDSLMGTPWESIIKEYRRQLGNRQFDHLKQYQEDFISYLHREQFFCPSNNQELALKRWCIGINYYIISEAKSAISIGDPSFPSILRQKIQDQISKFSSNERLPEFQDYTYEEFATLIGPQIREMEELSFDLQSISIDDTDRDLLKQAYYAELIVKEFNTTTFTGLVFTGFGKTEMFPSLIPLQVYFGFSNRLRYFVNEGKGSIISHDSTSGICTFAQSDVMHTILTGVAPELKETYNLTFDNLLRKLVNVLVNNSADIPSMTDLFQRINLASISNEFQAIMEDVITKKYIIPLFAAVSGLAKEDLGEMAESLIYLTYLQRRITNAEESVGGPVDVAVLSKGDGFIWLKRKHYFKPDLNSHFFKNYFNLEP